MGQEPRHLGSFLRGGGSGYPTLQGADWDAPITLETARFALREALTRCRASVTTLSGQTAMGGVSVAAFETALRLANYADDIAALARWICTESGAGYVVDVVQVEGLGPPIEVIRPSSLLPDERL